MPSRMESTKRKIVFELILDGHLSKNDATATTTQIFLLKSCNSHPSQQSYRIRNRLRKLVLHAGKNKSAIRTDSGRERAARQVGAKGEADGHIRRMEYMYVPIISIPSTSRFTNDGSHQISSTTDIRDLLDPVRLHSHCRNNLQRPELQQPQHVH